MDESLAWLGQALADRAAAEREYQANAGAQVWCHAIAKYQQTVEKAIKAIVAGLKEAGFWKGPPIGFAHDVQRHLRWLVRLPRAGFLSWNRRGRLDNRVGIPARPRKIVDTTLFRL